MAGERDVNRERVDHSARHIVAITPDDDADLARHTRYISLTVAGTLRITTVDGQVISYPTTGLAIGVLHPIAARRIHSTSTAATGIFAYS